MNQYKILGRIGQGAHGYVMKGFHRLTNENVALKKIIIKSLEEGIPKALMREIMTLQLLNSEYIVKLLDVIPHGMGLVLVMEYLPTSLLSVLKDNNILLQQTHIKCYMKMLLCGLNFMHENNIMHRDLKPANLLIADNSILKIADFGQARIYIKNDLGRQYSHQVATRWYRAPELLYGSRNYTLAIDLWAVGCIMAEMVLKKPLFSGETDIEQLAIVLHTLGTPTEETCPGLTELPDYNKITFAKNLGLTWHEILPNVDEISVELISGFIQYDHSKRVTTKQALQHQYFSTSPLPCSLEEMPKPENIKTYSSVDHDHFDQMFFEFEKLMKDF